VNIYRKDPYKTNYNVMKKGNSTLSVEYHESSSPLKNESPSIQSTKQNLTKKFMMNRGLS
jgi:hypothetical protein